MRALLLAGVVAMGWVGSAEASYILTLTESNGRVVASGTGTIDTAGLTQGTSSIYGDAIYPSYFGHLLLGTTTPAAATEWYGSSGPASFGPGSGGAAVDGSGDKVGFLAADTIVLPADYLSGQVLNSTADFGSATFLSLGVTAGTYVYTWGTGVDADTFTLNAVEQNAVTVPEPASLALLGMGGAGLAMLQRRRRHTGIETSI